MHPSARFELERSQPSSPEEAARDQRSALAAPIMEVFASIQGEGAFVGEPQVFVRLQGCPLRCRWCDTKSSWSSAPSGGARIAGARGERPESPWGTPFQVLCWIAEVENGLARTISVTGGEPLMWPDFCLGLSSLARPRRMHLETGGGHPETLARVLSAYDHVSIDLKHPSDLGPPSDLGFELAEPSPSDEEGWRRARRACLHLLRGRNACGKIVVGRGRRVEDFEELLDDVEELLPALPLVLQPATAAQGSPRGKPRLEASPELCRELCERALERGLCVRVLPQVHRFMGWR